MKKKVSAATGKNNNTISLICGILYTVLAVIIRLFNKNPYEVLHRIDTGNIMLPLWIFNIFSFAMCFISGFAAGIIIHDILSGKSGGRKEIKAYQGGLLFLTVIFLSLVWYSVFFGSEALFIAFLISLLSLCLSVAVTYLWSYTNLKSTLMMAVYSVWMFYIFLLNLFIIFNN